MNKHRVNTVKRAILTKLPWIIGIVLSSVAILYFRYYSVSGLALNYNDARSHLDIGRRVVEGLKPGLAQLGSVWLPLNHVLMIPLIWNDWAWHTGFAGAVWNMLSYAGIGLIIDRYIQRMGGGAIGRIFGVVMFAANLNILYLQSTAMTEPLLLLTMMAGCYYLLKWHQTNNLYDLIKSSFWIMLSTLVRYDGWFLLGYAGILVVRQVAAQNGGKGLKEIWRRIEGTALIFGTLAGLGVVLWFGWNQLIFGDALYFALGPFSAHAQQLIMEQAGSLPTKYNMLLSIKVYMYALLYNAYTYPALVAIAAACVYWCDKSRTSGERWGSTALFAPLAFNIFALFWGFSVVFVQGISGDTWFNIRYGVMLVPSFAVFTGYLVHKAKPARLLLIGSLVFVLFFAFANGDSVALDDARVGSSQKNVSEVASYLQKYAKNEKGFILISAASHDAIIFSSGLPMKRFIHEGTGKYWDNALVYPDRWARWIIMRTYDDQDLTWKSVSRSDAFTKYQKVASYPFADIYELDAQYFDKLETEAVIQGNK